MSSPKSSLKGKVAVVTGSTQGLGEATLRLFHERGCRGLVITGRNEQRGQRLAKELTCSSCTAIFVRADLANLGECRNIMKVTDETFGTLDILVNAAATTDRGSLWDTSPEDYDRIMNVNARAPFFLMQDAARIMEREKIEGSIINISSTASYGSMPMLSAYGMSKGALNVATKNAAYSLMWSRIRVNALAIGWMDTPGEDDIQRRLHCGSQSGNNWKQEGERNQPFGRLLKPDEVARCIAFCASEESGMMTGCVIDFDQSVWGAGNAPVPPRKEEWARANGMTFSFDHTPAKSAPTFPKTSSAKSESAVPKQSPAKGGGTGAIPSAFASSAKSRNSSPGRYRWQQSAKEQPSTSPKIDSESPRDAVTRDRESTPSSPTYKSPEPSSETDIVGSPPEPKAAEENEAPCAPQTTESRSESVKEPTSKPKQHPMDEPYPDEHRPDPREFVAMRKMQRDGELDRPDEYLPGTNPFADDQRKKEKAKKKFQGNPDSYGTSKVDDWIGSGKTQKRSWKPKGEHTLRS